VRKLQDFRPNYTSLHVAPDGGLTPVTGATIDVAAGTSPTQVFPTPLARLVVTTELGGGIRAFRVGTDGTLSQAPGSPLSPPPSVYPPRVDPSERVALGIAAHPFRRLVYVTMPSAPALAVYSYTAGGRLRFVRAVREADAYNPCWVHVSPGGRFLYTSNVGT